MTAFLKTLTNKIFKLLVIMIGLFIGLFIISGFFVGFIEGIVILVISLFSIGLSYLIIKNIIKLSKRICLLFVDREQIVLNFKIKLQKYQLIKEEKNREKIEKKYQQTQEFKKIKEENEKKLQQLKEKYTKIKEENDKELQKLREKQTKIKEEKELQKSKEREEKNKIKIENKKQRILKQKQIIERHKEQK